MRLDYVDIFYHHVPDGETPVEETMLALDNAVRQGKALYAGISNYNTEQTRAALEILRELKTPFVLNQAAYSMFNRWVETDGLIELARNEGFGLIAYSPLAQGLLTEKYFKGIPEDSRIGKGNGRWIVSALTPEAVEKAKKLAEVAKLREQTLSQMALSWVLRDKAVSSVIIGASKPRHIIENVEAIGETDFSPDELTQIEAILKG
jgi:L-glyceraldehyde 3-phosphate reductase